MRLSLILALLLATATVPVTAETVSSIDLARKVAEQMAPREQMRGMMIATLAGTTTGRMIATKVGAEHAMELFKSATDQAVERHGAEWTDLLAAAYRETLSPVELQRASDAFERNDKVTMMPLMERVGPVMQQKATPLLRTASAEALRAAYEQAMKEPEN